MASGIYEIVNVHNGRRYVGSAMSIDKRWKEHRRGLGTGRHHSRFLQRCWDKYGPDSFRFSVLLICSRANLLMYEQAAIDALQPEYNTALVAGSRLGVKMSDESKAKLSEAAKRTRNFTGHRHSEESKAKISASRKGKGGGPMGAERRAKIGAAHKGRVVTQERRAKISATLTGKSTGRGKLTDDQVRAIREKNAQGLRQMEIADCLGLPRKYVHTVVRRHGYTWVN